MKLVTSKPQFFSAFILAVSVLCIMASTTTQKTTTAIRTVSFDYDGTAKAEPGSANFLVGFIKPAYATKFNIRNEMFDRFKSALAGDIEETLIGKGFRIKGPYETQDEMLYDDKKDVQLVIVSTIEPEFIGSQGQWHSQKDFMTGQLAYSYKGTTTLQGKINLVGIEPLTGEKVWAKSVNIPEQSNIPIVTSQKYTGPLQGDDIFKDPGVYNAVGDALAKTYTDVMRKIEVHFNPEEFKSLAPSIKDLKAKKGF